LRASTASRIETDIAMNNKAINLNQKLSLFNEHWSPKKVSSFNGHDVMVVKALGEFNWHKHDDTDDFFLILSGELTIEFRDGKMTLGAGEMYVIPKGVEHRTIATKETHMLLIEPAGTPNTGDAATAAVVDEI